MENAQASPRGREGVDANLKRRRPLFLGGALPATPQVMLEDNHHEEASDLPESVSRDLEQAPPVPLAMRSDQRRHGKRDVRFTLEVVGAPFHVCPGHCLWIHCHPPRACSYLTHHLIPKTPMTQMTLPRSRPHQVATGRPGEERCRVLIGLVTNALGDIRRHGRLGFMSFAYHRRGDSARARSVIVGPMSVIVGTSGRVGCSLRFGAAERNEGPSVS